VVRLSADEREMAAMMGMTDQEYLSNKRELQKAGRLH
jgi:phage I-like protein